MKKPIILLLLLICPGVWAANDVPTADESIPIPKVNFDAKGNLTIKASATSSPSDFDFLVGKWKMYYRHLDAAESLMISALRD